MSDGKNLISTNKDVPVMHIPEFPNLKDSVEYVLTHNAPKENFPLATISTNSNQLIFNCCHTFGDGSHLKRIVSELQNPTNTPLPKLPTPILTTFSEELSRLSPLSHDYRDPMFTHLKNQTPEKADPTDVFQNIVSKFPANTLSCYHNGKISGLTEHISASLVLSAKAIGGLSDGFGTQNAVDLRPFLPKHLQKSLGIIDHVGMVIMTSQKPKTFGDLKKDFRATLNDAISRKLFFNHMKWDILHYCSDEGVKEELPLQGLMVLLSNVGQVHIKKPITDVMMRVDMEEPYSVASIISYSVISEKENSVRTHLTYGAKGTTKHYMERLNKVFEYAMRNFQPSLEIDKAIDILRKIDKK
ncbi:hypothetical protein GPJ56_001434 [Histomonas meleagridis]|uniref:uncharacterized protein n=1 Tax=Histomonas meleagridis TaxID=135588 RepID=UPI00355A887A|nr:hypothetical protein GPJ56_001434 [Histomonas meleagridis]KAH0798194.1 hypothetical protein GO595_009040 [Histomonas meleagridis]